MLSIVIDGNPMFIAQGTSIQMEVNSSVFSTDKIEGDIVFTFEVPSALNDMVFQHARFVYVKRMKKYACEILAGGVEIANGELYIQKATQTSYSCGLVLNPFPAGYSDRKLKENDYGNDLIISRNPSEHNSKWLEFLSSTLPGSSHIKFPLFIDTSFYGSSNNDFGWFLLDSDTPDSGHTSGFQASIGTNDNVGLERCFINRLFINNYGSVIVQNTGSRGIRVFNNPDVDNPNSFAFCPALRLTWLLGKVMENAGYRTCGDFFSNTDILKIYSQSLQALDGLQTEYEQNEAGVSASVTPACDWIDTTHESLILPFCDANGNEHFYVRPRVAGAHQMQITINTFLPGNLLSSYPAEELTCEELLILFFGYEDFEEYNFIRNNYSELGRLEEGEWTPAECYFKIYAQSTISQIGYSGAGFYHLAFSFFKALYSNRNYRFLLAKAVCYTDDGDYYMIDHLENIPVTQDVGTYFKVYNCFANKLAYKDHVPNLTNAEFVNTVCNAFGLAFFIDSSTKLAQFTFIKDVLGSDKVLDLTQYAVDNETALEKQDDKKYSFCLQGIDSDDVDEDKKIPPVISCQELPSAAVNFGKYCFVVNENRYRKAEREGDGLNNWVFKWNPACGNDRKLEVGVGDEQDIKPSLKIPTMKMADMNSTNQDLVLQIETHGCSPIFDTGTSDFELFLVNYVGRRRINCLQFSSPYFEAAQPTCYDKDGGLLAGVSLSATGENSVGESYVRSWLDFLANSERVKYRLVLPLSAFLQLWQTFKPQDVQTSQQIRWLYIGNVRSLPCKMTVQFTEGKDMIIADVEAAIKKV